MNKIRFVLAAALLAFVVPAQAAVNNISLAQTGVSGVSGTATTIIGDVAGTNPYHNVEVNIQANQPPPGNMVYQGWLVDGKDNYKMSLGTFTGIRLSFRQRMVGSLASMPYDSVAVSLDPANNASVQPTTIVAQGSLPGTTVSAADFPTVAVLPRDESFQRQAITAAFHMTNDQYNSLRMMGWGPTNIALIGNVAAKCNKSPMDIANMLSQGQTWDQIASASGTTTAMIFQPIPFQAVAGSMEQTGAMAPTGTMYPARYVPGMTMSADGTPLITVPPVYRRYANGRPIITRMDWVFFRRAGYSWQDVATAANISAITGESPDLLLRQTSVRGLTWAQIAEYRGISFNQVSDVSGWPFSKRGGEAPSHQQSMQQGNQSGAAGMGGAGAAPEETLPPDC